MSKKCELTGKNPMKGHNVSHANNKTKRRFLPNLKKVKFTSELMKRSLKLTVSNAGVRSVDKKGSFDEYLKTVKNKNLSTRLKKLKKGILIKSPFKKKLPINEAAEPKAIKTKEKPKVKKIVLVTTRFFFLFKIFFSLLTIFNSSSNFNSLWKLLKSSVLGEEIFIVM